MTIWKKIRSSGLLAVGKAEILATVLFSVSSWETPPPMRMRINYKKHSHEQTQLATTLEKPNERRSAVYNTVILAALPLCLLLLCSTAGGKTIKEKKRKEKKRKERSCPCKGGTIGT
jgi:hypothetical protein